MEKEISINKHLLDEKHKKALMTLSKEDLIERYFHRLPRAASAGFLFGSIFGSLITLWAIGVSLL